MSAAKLAFTSITVALASTAAVFLSGCASIGNTALRDQVADVPPAQTVSYTGSPQTVTVPESVTSMTLTVKGGDGGTVLGDWGYGSGAIVAGTMPVTPGDVLTVGVGGVGQDGWSGSTPSGGWGGLGMSGGNGKSEKDHARTSAAGGGATTIQLTRADGSGPATLVVAAGGGGIGGVSGDPGNSSDGGNAGDGWAGGNGTKGSPVLGGSGGNAGVQSTGAGGAAGHGSQEGGNGGGGGGGVLGGGGGGGAKGTSAGGGGGSGTSSSFDLQGATIADTNTAAHSPQNGSVQIVWA